jgi:hypothetical protein
MKKYFISVLLILSTILPFFCAAQDKLIKLSPEISDTIDLIEREYYSLYPNLTDFQYAMIYLSSDSTTITKIICRNDEGLVRDTVIINSADYVGNLKTYIRQINLDRLENYDSDDKIAVTKLGGEKFVGKLLAVQDSSFILCPDTISGANTGHFIKTHVKLNIQEVESIFIDFDNSSSVQVGAIIGGITGCIAGIVIGVNNPVLGISSIDNSESVNLTPFVGGLLGCGVGALLGAGVGYLLSPEDEVIEINSASDLELLKEYVVQ